MGPSLLACKLLRKLLLLPAGNMHFQVLKMIQGILCNVMIKVFSASTSPRE
jgi:hypothetical protein